MAEEIGLARAAEEMRPNHRPGEPRRHGHHDYRPETVRSLHRIGALTELAFARYYGFPFEETYRPDRVSGDVAGRQVRSTGHRTGCLLMHDTDVDYFPYHLVVWQHDCTLFRVAGWVFGVEGKRLGDRCEPQPGRPCILVPQDRLRMPPDPQPWAIENPSVILVSAP